MLSHLNYRLSRGVWLQDLVVPHAGRLYRNIELGESFILGH